MTAEDYLKLGIAVARAQTIEFALYGFLTHLKKTPEIVKDKRLRELTPRQFLSSDPEHKSLRKMTLGQLNKILPDQLGLDPDYMESYVTRRNLIAHDFMRELNPKYVTNGVIDPSTFLAQFISDSEELQEVLLGLLYTSMDYVADKNLMPDRKPVGLDVEKAKNALYSHILKSKNKKANKSQ